jgi:hypothetical protein
MKALFLPSGLKIIIRNHPMSGKIYWLADVTDQSRKNFLYKACMIRI